MSTRHLFPFFVVSLFGVTSACTGASEDGDDPASAVAAVAQSQGRVFDGRNGNGFRILEVEGRTMIASLGDARVMDFKRFDINGTSAIFPSGDFGPAECSLTLTFASKWLDIAQKGTCRQFEHPVAGRYDVRPANALVGTYRNASDDQLSVTASDDDLVHVSITGANGGAAAACVGEFSFGPSLLAECRGARLDGGCDLVFDPSRSTITLAGVGCSRMAPVAPGPFLRR